ncbi:TPA: hypothetical protein DCY43_01680 [candidate division WWE3 bacterium]|uniref:Uncharacterized protein n=3 Tax=Katanobacteria TaxID=422282 RepID=A0A1F4V3Z4_UNCKA|nr:MAG: hypothetical protein UW65_C0014G0013 [candidate division WWE3 bacterium GW2011_GWB1_44_4]OGC51934.1 MAG: hypothetical protein A2709_02450 [candidate division WWE3 bacterium RIFCSPHIGHO2_01_FULL_43_9]HAZ29448.1 hypothetical protein [candidate division WWE3 bacterium]
MFKPESKDCIGAILQNKKESASLIVIDSVVFAKWTDFDKSSTPGDPAEAAWDGTLIESVVTTGKDLGSDLVLISPALIFQSGKDPQAESVFDEVLSSLKVLK